MTVDVSDATFDNEVHRGDTLVLVDFWSTWCGPCQRLLPVLKELDEDYPEELKIVKANSGYCPETCKKYKVTAVPTLLIVRNGKILAKVTGGAERSQLEEILVKYGGLKKKEK